MKFEYNIFFKSASHLTAKSEKTTLGDLWTLDNMEQLLLDVS